MNIVTYYKISFPQELSTFSLNKIETYGTDKETLVLRIKDTQKEVNGNYTFIHDKNYFILSLYFIILTDLSIFTHFKKQYPLFKSRTNFPKIMYGFNGKPAPPYITLNLIDINTSTKNSFLELADYFIKNEWGIELTKIVDIKLNDFKYKLINDLEFATVFDVTGFELLLKKYLSDYKL